jgi:hypothetical protein
MNLFYETLRDRKTLRECHKLLERLLVPTSIL